MSATIQDLPRYTEAPGEERHTWSGWRKFGRRVKQCEKGVRGSDMVIRFEKAQTEAEYCSVYDSADQ